jgi:hypothetical protein
MVSKKISIAIAVLLLLAIVPSLADAGTCEGAAAYCGQLLGDEAYCRNVGCEGVGACFSYGGDDICDVWQCAGVVDCSAITYESECMKLGCDRYCQDTEIDVGDTCFDGVDQDCDSRIDCDDSDCTSNPLCFGFTDVSMHLVEAHDRTYAPDIKIVPENVITLTHEKLDDQDKFSSSQLDKYFAYGMDSSETIKTISFDFHIRDSKDVQALYLSLAPKIVAAAGTTRKLKPYESVGVQYFINSTGQYVVNPFVFDDGKWSTQSAGRFWWSSATNTEFHVDIVYDAGEQVHIKIANKHNEDQFRIHTIPITSEYDMKHFIISGKTSASKSTGFWVEDVHINGEAYPMDVSREYKIARDKKYPDEAPAKLADDTLEYQPNLEWLLQTTSNKHYYAYIMDHREYVDSKKIGFDFRVQSGDIPNTVYALADSPRPIGTDNSFRPHNSAGIKMFQDDADDLYYAVPYIFDEAIWKSGERFWMENPSNKFHVTIKYKTGSAEISISDPLKPDLPFMSTFEVKDKLDLDYFVLAGRTGTDGLTLITRSIIYEEVCDNGVDDDDDEYVDCDDISCSTYHKCLPEFCDNLIDDDGDNLVDCDDSDCEHDPICYTGEVCNDGIDNDDDCPGDTNEDGEVCGPGDFGVDCYDSSCCAIEGGYCDGRTCGDSCLCGRSETVYLGCVDHKDNNGDCPGDTNGDGIICGDGDDGVDCRDPDCYLKRGPVRGRDDGYCSVIAWNDMSEWGNSDDNGGRWCYDGYDNDYDCVGDVNDDGFYCWTGDVDVDCMDQDCNMRSCGTGCECRFEDLSQHEINCFDTGDNDHDGLRDCADVDDCDGYENNGAKCRGGEMIELICDDEIDNDDDGEADIGDSDCADARECDVRQDYITSGENAGFYCTYFYKLELRPDRWLPDTSCPYGGEVDYSNFFGGLFGTGDYVCYYEQALEPGESIDPKIASLAETYGEQVMVVAYSDPTTYEALYYDDYVTTYEKDPYTNQKLFTTREGTEAYCKLNYIPQSDTQGSIAIMFTKADNVYTLTESCEPNPSAVDCAAEIIPEISATLFHNALEHELPYTYDCDSCPDGYEPDPAKPATDTEFYCKSTYVSPQPNPTLSIYRTPGGRLIKDATGENPSTSKKTTSPGFPGQFYATFEETTGDEVNYYIRTTGDCYIDKRTTVTGNMITKAKRGTGLSYETDFFIGTQGHGTADCTVYLEVDNEGGEAVREIQLEVESYELCDDEIDNDGDGDIDCADDNCAFDDVCFVCHAQDSDEDGFKECHEALDGTLTQFENCGDYICDCNDNSADLNPDQVWYRDEDEDRYTSGDTRVSCNIPSDPINPAVYRLEQYLNSMETDCDDTVAAINPGESEVCDEVDNNCDGTVDEGLRNIYYVDLDNDGYGILPSIEACTEPILSADMLGDCDDELGYVNPGKTEVCGIDGVDEDCSGLEDCLDPVCSPNQDCAHSVQSYCSDYGVLLDTEYYSSPATIVNHAGVLHRQIEFEQGDYAEIDYTLDGSYLVTIELDFVDLGDSVGYPTKYTLAISQDGKQWKLINNAQITPVGDIMRLSTEFKPVATKYVKLIVYETSGIQINPGTGLPIADDTYVLGFAGANFEDSSEFQECWSECIPQCDINTCGSDGCSGTCGTCESEQVCSDQEGGSCVDPPILDITSISLSNTPIRNYAQTDITAAVVNNGGTVSGSFNLAFLSASEITDTIISSFDPSESYVIGIKNVPYSDVEDMPLDVNLYDWKPMDDGVQDVCVFLYDQDTPQNVFDQIWGNQQKLFCIDPSPDVLDCQVATDCTDYDNTDECIVPECTAEGDCDYTPDEKVNYYLDFDGDTYGDSTTLLQRCVQPDNYVAENTDCDDANAAIHINAPEICDGEDNNCDGTVDEDLINTYYLDRDGDTYGTDQSIIFGAPTKQYRRDDNEMNAYTGVRRDLDVMISTLMLQRIRIDVDLDEYSTAELSVYGRVTGCTKSEETASLKLNYVDTVKFDPCEVFTEDFAWQTIDVPLEYLKEDYSNTFRIMNWGTATLDIGYDTDTTEDRSVRREIVVDETDTKRHIFVSNAEVTGRIVYPVGSSDPEYIGIDAADAICRSEAEAEGLDGTYIALISTSTQDARDRLSGDSYYNANAGGTPLAYSKSDLFGAQGRILNTIYTLDGGYGHHTLTGSDQNGQVIVDKTCSDWISEESTDIVAFGGSLDIFDTSWIYKGEGSCDVSDIFDTHIYCVQSDATTYTELIIDEDFEAMMYLDIYSEDIDPIVQACSAPAGYVESNTDCDDIHDTVYPDAPEICDELDNDCEGDVDEGFDKIYYADSDGDTYGDLAQTTSACVDMLGYVRDSTDCDDTLDTTYPGADELCDELDNDCDTSTDEDFVELEAECFLGVGACRQSGVFICSEDGAETICNAKPKQPQTEDCATTYDDDCDGTANEDCECVPLVLQQCGTTDVGLCEYGEQLCKPDGTWAACQNAVESVDEICDGDDNDCDGFTDEGLLHTYYVDSDGDSYGTTSSIEACSITAGYAEVSGDCDDAKDIVNPGEEEGCDGLDNNCDGRVDEGFIDTDADGDADCIDTDDDNDGDLDTNDCKPLDSTVYHGATEICDGKDNNCNNDVDEGLLIDYHPDSDGDTYGDPNFAEWACSAPAGYVESNTDCDDTDPEIHIRATESCDGVDNNCNDQIDESFTDTDTDGDADCIDTDDDNDGYLDTEDCKPLDATIHPGATEICDGVDQDCDGEIDEGVKTTYYHDGDRDGYGDLDDTTQACTKPDNYFLDNTDCDDTDDNIHPGATETCDGADQDCNGLVDDDATDMSTYYLDADGDGYGIAQSTQACTLPAGYANVADDCDDTEETVNPGRTEICDGLDNNCDTVVDEGYVDTDNDGEKDCLDDDDDGDGDLDTTDCKPLDATIHAGAEEICGNNIDEDCDGQDEVCYELQDADGDTFKEDVDCDDNNDKVYPGATELCDGLDNDCDDPPQIDENWDVGEICYSTGDGACRTEGVKVCDTEYRTKCNAVDGTPTTEICINGIDEDCDGTADDGCQCTPNDKQQCGSTDVGECEYGEQTCAANGIWGSCIGATEPVAEVCNNNRDEDCDGTPDNGCDSECPIGDVNGDCSLTVSDLIVIANNILNPDQYDECNDINICDANEDNQVTVSDLIMFANIILGGGG